MAGQSAPRAGPSHGPSGVDLARLRPGERLHALEARPEGLADDEVRARLSAWGPNLPPAGPGRAPLLAFLGYFTHTLALLLWFAAGLAAAADARELAAAIVAVVVLNGAFAFLQEWRAERVIARLIQHVAPTATARRAGRLQRVQAAELVPGDIVLLGAEDIVPADCVLLEAEALSLDLSLLTGESEPVPRSAEAIEVTGTGRAIDLAPVAPAGSAVVAGSATALVFATGSASTVGSIAHLVAGIDRGDSKLEQQVAALSRTTAVIAVLAGAIALVLARMTTSLEFVQALTFATGVIVALVPEGLLPTLSVSLAIGARRMAARGAAVRRLSAVEVIGSVTTICTDKTGTLTLNQLTVETFLAPSPDPACATRAAECAATCSDLRTGPGGDPTGDPIDVALDRWTRAQGVDADAARRRERLAETPFESHRRYMSVTCDVAGVRRVYLKGAPEVVLAMARPADGDAEFRRRLDEEASRGRRLLMFATGPEGGPLEITGAVAVADPLRPEVPGAVAGCHRAGVHIVMLTGDHPATAQAVARDAGLHDFHVTSGADLDRLADADVLARLRGDAVFARIDPEQKLRIVRLLRNAGETVVVTGDGINDAPALGAADVGVAMGLRGTDVAKQAADIVLADDNFATIVAAIEEGRAVKENIRRFVSYHFTSNVAELAPFLAYVFFPIPLPLAITQVIAVDLGTDLLPAMALGVEPPSRGLMGRDPEPHTRPLLTRALALKTFLVFGLIEATLGLAAYFAYWWIEAGWRPFQAVVATSGMAEREAATVTFLAIVGGQIGCLFASRDGGLRSRLSLRSNHLLRIALAFEIAAALSLTLVPGLNGTFSMEAPAPAWLLVIPGAAAIFLAADGLRRILRRALAGSLPRARKKDPWGAPSPPLRP